MKKIVFYIPAIISTLFYGMIMLGTGLSVLPLVYVWLALFITSGILLSKERIWGGALGMLPGFQLMFMSTQNRGQVLPIEMPLGIIITAFYVSCCVFIFYQKRKVQN